jgi:hypothetical protein
MKSHHALLAAVAVGALIAPNAQAAEKRHAHHAHAALAKANDGALKSEVEQLKAEVAELRAEIRAQHETSTATQTQVATLQTQTSSAAQAASAAQTTASSAVAKADTAVAKADAVKTAEASTEKKVGAMAWAGDTKVGGAAFFNFSNVNQQANGAKQSVNGTGFNLKRVYLTVDHKFNDVWSANITTDVSNVIGETGNNNYATPTANTTTGAISSIGLVGKGLYIKKAYLQAKLDRALVIRAGAADTAWVPYIEGIYGHRYIENVLLDEYKLGTSADWGVSASGELADGLVSYQVGVVNGAGYRSVQVSNSVDLDGRLSVQYKGFFGAVGGYSGKLGKNTQGTVTAHTANRIDGALGYKSDLFTVAGEYTYAKDFGSVTNAAFEDKNEAWSVFANYNITPKWQVFGRYDWIRQTNNTTAGTSVKNDYYNIGLQWEVAKTVDLSLVYKRAQATNFGTAAGTIAWQNGTGSIGGTTNGTYDEVGLFGFIKF